MAGGVELIGDDPAVAHLDPARGAGGDAHIVRHEHERHVPFAVQLLEQVEDHSGILAVEVAGRLIGEQDRWTIGQAACDGHALALPSREFRRKMMQSPFQAD